MLRNQVEVGRRPAFRRLVGGTAVAALAVVAFSSAVTQAQAAVPDSFGFVLWNGSAPVSSGTWPAATSVLVSGAGRYQVTFPGQASSTVGVAHVTAINNTPHWCQINSLGTSGPDEVVGISCYKVGGAADPTSFSAIFDSSSGPAVTPGAFGYVNALPSGSLVSSYNSASAANSVIPGPTGVWTVKFPALSTPGPIDGSLQATAVNPQVPARCKVAKWSSSTSAQIATVLCFDATGAPFNTQFTLTYQYQRALYGGFAPPKNFGYLWNTPPLGPVSTNFNLPAGAGANTISGSGGLWLVTFPLLAVLPDDIQVTAAGSGSEFCGLNVAWGHSGSSTLVRDVNCFNNAGAAVNTGFLVSDNSVS